MPINSTGVQPFIPELWTAALMEPFQREVVFGQAPVVSNDYTGEIMQKGDTVHVGAVGAPTVRTLDVTRDIEVEDLNINDTSLKIDQGDYFAFYVNSVDEVQAAGPLKEPAIREAAAGMAEKVDQYIANIFKTDAGTKIGIEKVHGGRSEAAGAVQTAFEAVVKLGKALDMKRVPKQGRFVVVGPSTHAALLLDERFGRVDASGTGEGLYNGLVGRAAGFDVLVSNDVPTTAKRELMCAGYYGAITLATQIVKVETQRTEKRFADLVKGFQVYGAKAFRPHALATLDADFAVTGG